MTDIAEFADRVFGKLAEDGIPIPDSARAQLDRHVALVQEMNRVVSLVSAGDLDNLWVRHVADSLSLAPVICSLGSAAGILLDIGSGGGFPAIPLKVILPSLKVTLLERSEKKLGFLRKVVGALGLAEVRFLCGEYPVAAAGLNPDLLTARAVERPDRLLPEILLGLGPATSYLCQNDLAIGPEWRVNDVKDSWSSSGLRRGVLRVVSRAV